MDKSTEEMIRHRQRKEAGRCQRCGRKLIDRDSMARGMGPQCYLIEMRKKQQRLPLESD